MMESDRILLRPWRESDAATLYKWASDPLVGPRAGWPPHQSVEESLEIIRTVFNNDCNWAIVLKSTGEVIGAIGYGPACECELPAREGEPLTGYWIARPYWNRGICTEALRLMLDHIRATTDIRSLVSGHFIDNPASGRVMEKCGFIPTGETCIDETQYQGKDRPIRVLRLELVTRILFLCHGNICRSPMAEFMLKDMVKARGLQDRFYIESAAVSSEEIGNPIYPPAKRCLNRHGIWFDPGKQARAVTRADYDRFDVIICMDRSNIRMLRWIIPDDPQHKVRMMMSYAGLDRDVADPWYTGDFETTYRDLTAGLEGLLAGYVAE